MTIAQAAEALGLAPGTLYRQIKQKKLKATRVGSVLLITPAQLEAYKRNSWGQKKGNPRPYNPNPKKRRAKP